MTQAEDIKNGAGGSKAVDAAAVARLPYPGTVVPGAIAFTSDGTAITYLKSDSNSLSRVLWKTNVAPDSAAVVIARPPGEGTTEQNVSPEEALRRERLRLRETGITQVVRAEKADVLILPLAGDLYLARSEGGPLDRLTESETPELDPKLTDDGSKVAFVRDGELVALDLATRQETQLTRGAAEGLTHGLAEFIAQEELDRSSGFWWAPDGSRLAFEEVDERSIPLYSIVHQGDDKVSVETHRYPFAGAENARVRLGVVSATGGETRWLPFAEPGEDVYLARVEWAAPKTLLVQVLDRDQKRLRLVRIDVESGERTLLIEETADTWINLHHDLRFVEGTGEVLWSSERSGFRHLELRDPDGRLVRVLTEGDWPVDSVAALDSSRREVWFAAGRESPLETHLYRVSLDGGPIRRLTEGTGTHRAIVAGDCEHFVEVASCLDQPPVATIRDREGGLIATFDDAATDPRVKEYRLEPPQLASVPSREGATLHGAFYAPQSKTLGQKAPLIVLVYGGPHVQMVTNSWGLTADLTAQFLAARGFAVWKMDNRGSARRGHEFEAALNRRLGDVEVRDQVEGVRFVASRWSDQIDPARVGITGGSYGGYMTLRCLTEAADTFRAGVAIAPVTDWDGYDTGYTERYLGTPANNSDGYKASSVLPRAQELRGDVLIIHGMLDENVHFRHSARLASALISARRPFTLLPLPAERHSSRRPEGRRYVIEKMADFFEQSLGK